MISITIKLYKKHRKYHVSQKGVQFSMKNKNQSDKLTWKSTSSHVYKLLTQQLIENCFR